VRRQALRRLKRKLALRGHIEDRFADEARFIRSWLEKPLVTGAVSPSGKALARAMAMHVDPHAPGPVVELGPGTGPVTEALIRRGVAPHRLVLVEYDVEFCKRLARRFPKTRVIHGDAYALDATVSHLIEEPAAAIVSSLPLLVKPDAKRIALLDAAFELLGPGAPFIQFTYGVVSPIPTKIDGHKLRWFTAEASPPVWLNLPPARVWVYRRRAELDARPAEAIAAT
jgi:phosphatidylethanolamine/phosphatidyl-N-methylethanolamine N-methyltransferase